MKLLFVITGLGVGGAERVVTNLADGFSHRGHSVKVVSLTGLQLMAPRCPEVEVANLYLAGVRDIWRVVRALITIVDEYQPDIVHAHMYHAIILCRAVRLVRPAVKLVTTAHSSLIGGRIRKLAYRLTERLSDISTNVSSEAVEAFIKGGAASRGQMIPLHNGIDTDVFKFSLSARRHLRSQLLKEENAFMFLAVGRMHESKDYPTLIEAFAAIAKNNTYLFIVGCGELHDQLVRLASSHNVANNIIFLGRRDDIPQLMSATDAFVLSSKWEGFGMVVAEAMACERLVVATDCGGVREVVGGAGLLVPPRDVAALAAAMEAAYGMADAARFDIGLAARKRVYSFYSLESSLDKWIKLYESL